MPMTLRLQGAQTLGTRTLMMMGWVTVTAYLAAAYLCYRAGRGGIGEQLPPRVARIWYGLAVLLLALGINKQLDLQLLIRDLGKFALDAFAWQGKRHLIQSIYIGLVACGGMAIVGLLAWWARGAWRTVGGAFAGCVFLLCFVVVRAGEPAVVVGDGARVGMRHL